MGTSAGTKGPEELLNKKSKEEIPSVAHWVKDMALPQLWHRLQLCRFDPWPGCGQIKKKKKEFS